MRTYTSLMISTFMLAACGGGSGVGQSSSETAAADSQNITLKMTPVADGLEFPWGLAVLPDGNMLVTEREGRIRVIRDGVLQDAALSGAPEAYVDNQGGYLGLALDPNFASNNTLYMSYASGDSGANRTTVIRAKIDDELSAISDVQEIFRGAEKQGGAHFGGQLEFLPDGTLLISLGDGFKWMDEAQNTDNYFGKVARINTDGSIPQDNPFADGAAPAIFSYGHRNIQGLVYDPATDTIWEHEHGPKGGDELNILEPGNNYGWPKITYGVNYNGSIITTETEAEGMEQPKVKWVPSIAPSGMELYTGDKYPGWKGDLFIGAMNGPEGQKLVRIDLDGNEVIGKEDLLTDEALPIRAVVQGADGYLYVATHEPTGTVYRLDIE